MKIEKRLILSWSVVILWMILIFAFSAQPADESNEVSLGITAILLRFIENLGITTDVSADWIGEINNIVRKSAHAFVFFVLAMLAVNAFLSTKAKGFKAFLFAFIFTFFYACTDEIHQIFVPGRACMLSDVGIDSIGAVIGLCLFGFGYWVNRHKKIKVVGR